MLTLHYQRPLNETQAFPFRSFEDEKLVEESHFHQAISDFDTWDAFASGFDRIVSFRNLAAHSGEQIEKNKETRAPMNTQENPFPWRLFYGKIIDSNGNTVCTLPSRQSNESANLIAASPDMLQALQAMVDAFGDQNSILIDQCKAALGKAIGKQ